MKTDKNNKWTKDKQTYNGWWELKKLTKNTCKVIDLTCRSSCCWRRWVRRRSGAAVSSSNDAASLSWACNNTTCRPQSAASRSKVTRAPASTLSSPSTASSRRSAASSSHSCCKIPCSNLHPLVQKTNSHLWRRNILTVHPSHINCKRKKLGDFCFIINLDNIYHQRVHQALCYFLFGPRYLLCEDRLIQAAPAIVLREIYFLGCSLGVRS